MRQTAHSAHGAAASAHTPPRAAGGAPLCSITSSKTKEHILEVMFQIQSRGFFPVQTESS